MKENENKVTALAFLFAALAVLCLIPVKTVSIDTVRDKHIAVYSVTCKKPVSGAVDLNTAEADIIAEACGIEPELAEMIVRYRLEYGPFGSVDELLYVYGINEKTLEKIRPFVMAGDIYR